MLSKVPILSSTFENVYDGGLQLVSKEGLSQRLNKTVTNNKIKVDVTDVFYDGSRLAIGYHATAFVPGVNIYEMTKEQLNATSLTAFEIKVNGKKVKVGSSGSGSIIDILPYYKGKKLTDVLPDSFNLNLNITKVGKIVGKWDFEIPVKKVEIGVKTFHPTEVKSYRSVTFTVKEVEVGITRIKLTYDISMPINQLPFDKQDLFVDLISDKGEVIHIREGHGDEEIKNGMITYHYENYFIRSEQNLGKFIIVRPFIQNNMTNINQYLNDLQIKISLK